MSDKFQEPADHAERMRAARAWATWHLGNPDWAELIMGAYSDPEAAHAGLQKSKAKYDLEHEVA